MKELRSEIEIEAPTERVWGVLTDFAAYPEWNPFIRRVSGRAELEEMYDRINFMHVHGHDARYPGPGFWEPGEADLPPPAAGHLYQGGGGKQLMAKCSFTKRDGNPCKGTAMGPNGGCWAHDPEYSLPRKRIARKGGQRGGRGRPNPGTADLARLQKAFEDLADDVLQGNVDRASAVVAVQCWNGARGCITAAARLRELEGVEARLEALEQTLSPNRSG